MRPSRLQYESRISSGVDFAAADLEREDGPSRLRYIRTTDIAAPTRLTADGVYVDARLVPDTARVLRGDLLFTRAGSVGTSYLHHGPEAAFAGYLVRCRLAPGNDPRFFAYWAQSRPFWDEVSVGAVRSTIDNFSARKYGSMPMPLPLLEVQRRIADYLDAETARIDNILQVNKRLISLLRERWYTLLETMIMEAAFEVVPLWLTCEMTPGFAYSSDDFVPQGPVRLLRGVNVAVGKTRWEDVVYADVQTVASTPHYELVEGDIVLGMDRPWIGSGLRVALISSDDLPAFLVQRVLRLRPNAGVLDADYLFMALQAPRFYAAFEPDMTGISVPHVSATQVGSFSLPLPPIKQQRDVSRALVVEHEALKAAVESVSRQSELLLERRHALVTSAVTGELEV